MNNILKSEKRSEEFATDLLWLFTMCYSLALMSSNWFNARLVCLFGLETDAGTLVFPLTFLLSDLITEVYGYKYAKRAIWIGFSANIFFLLYSQLIMNLPGPKYAPYNALFDKILDINFRIIFASILSYLISEPLNSFIMAKLKIRFSGSYMAARFIISTILAAAFDSCIFGILAFYNSVNNNNLINLILNMWFFKVIIEAALLPFSVRLANKLKTIEHMDRYDINTKFNIFSLDVTYDKELNKYMDKNNG